MSDLRNIVFSVFLLLATAACGGSGGGSFAGPGEEGGGIGGSGITALGEITGFGSIFVNGVEFDTANAEIIVNGMIAGEDALGLGMVVTVEGTVNADGVTGMAQRVVFDGTLRGPVSAVRVTDAVTQIEFRVLDQSVLADLSTTVFVGALIDDVADNDYVEISGFIAADGRLHATRVERIAEFVPGESLIARSGVVSNIDGTSFSLGDLSVDFATADVSALPGATVSNGLRVRVSGTLTSGVITATTIAPAGDVRTDLEPDRRLVIEGVISGFDGASAFRIGNVPVDAGEAELELNVDALANGLLVAVAGRWDGQALQATSVTSRQGEILLAAPLQDVDAERGTITLGLFNTSLSANVNALTLITDSTGRADRLRLTALAVNDYVTVEAVARGNTLHALQVSRGNARASALRAAVEDFTPGSQIVVQGIAIATTAATLQNAAGEPLSTGEFYGRLALGERVLVIDAQAPDGTADIVRFAAGEQTGG